MDPRQDFIAEIRRYSLNISEYLDNKLYRLDIEDPDTLTPTVIFNLVMTMVIDELRVMGIEVIAEGDVYADVPIIKGIEFIRCLFDIRQFPLMLARTPEISQFIRSSVENDELDPEVFVHDIVQHCHASFPLSLKWEHLAQCEDFFQSKPAFVDHVYRLATTAANTLTAQMDYDHMIPTYLKAVLEHSARVQASARYLAIHPSTSNIAEVDAYIKTLDQHDHDLTTLMPSEYIEMYLDVEDPHPAYSARNIDAPAILSHKQSHTHHLEHYRDADKDYEMPVQDIMTIVADLFRPTWTIDKNLMTLRNLFNQTVLDKSILVQMERLMRVLSTRSNV